MCGGYDLECADAANVLYYINPPSWEQTHSKSMLVYHKSSSAVHLAVVVKSTCDKLIASDTVKTKFAKFNEQLKDVKIQYNKDCTEGGESRYWDKCYVHC